MSQIEWRKRLAARNAPPSIPPTFAGIAAVNEPQPEQAPVEELRTSGESEPMPENVPQISMYQRVINEITQEEDAKFMATVLAPPAQASQPALPRVDPFAPSLGGTPVINRPDDVPDMGEAEAAGEKSMIDAMRTRPITPGAPPAAP